MSKICNNYYRWGQCPFPNCHFLHPSQDHYQPTQTMSVPHEKYRTRLCKNVICPFGTRCMFIHLEPELLNDVKETFFSK